VRVLGINCFGHDTAACLLDDGRLVALAEEERFNRQRHTKRFPDQAIGFGLGLAGIGIREVDVLAFAHRPRLDLALRGRRPALARVVFDEAVRVLGLLSATGPACRSRPGTRAGGSGTWSGSWTASAGWARAMRQLGSPASAPSAG
jgi:hypothetical protein